MRNLIIPDVHTKWQVADKIIEKERPDQIYFEGDYWDTFYDTVQVNIEVCRWIKDLATDPRVTFLLGNHDLHYISPNRAHRCSGFTWEKYKAISTLFPPEDSQRIFKLFVVVDGYLLTHAGITSQLFGRFPKDHPIDLVFNEAWEALFTEDQNHYLLMAGRDRGGPGITGGALWCDWGSFTPIRNIPQIVGHTSGREPRWTHWREDRCRQGEVTDELGFEPGDQISLCLDTNLRHYAVIEDGHVSIRPVPN